MKSGESRSFAKGDSCRIPRARMDVEKNRFHALIPAEKRLYNTRTNKS